MLIPAKPLLASWALVFLGAVGVAWMPEVRPYFYWGVGILLVLLLVDALLLWLEKPPQVRRQVANALPLWSEVEVTLRFENQAARTQVFTVYDHLPPEFETQQMPAALRVLL